MHMTAPDYGQSNIVNLMASIVTGLGGHSHYPTLAALSPDAVASADSVVLVLIDGLGYHFLRRHPNSFLCGQLETRLETVFPSTTATAVTTFLSGLAPLQHGVTGWFTYLKELGSVAAVLPFRPRHGGAPFSQRGIDPHEVFSWTPVFNRIAAESVVLNPEYIAESDFSRASSGRAQRRAYRTLSEYCASIHELVTTTTGSRYIHAYWPGLDRLAHEHGANSRVVSEHFVALDAGLHDLVYALHGTGALLVVCADHGLIDTNAAATVDLEQHPRLAATLTLPLCGEPRAAFCYVRSGCRHEFEDYVRGELADTCLLASSKRLLDDNWFGVGSMHSRLPDRIGDYALLMKDNYVIKDHVLGETAFMQVGVHGGISEEERYVPLITIPT